MFNMLVYAFLIGHECHKVIKVRRKKKWKDNGMMKITSVIQFLFMCQ